MSCSSGPRPFGPDWIAALIPVTDRGGSFAGVMASLARSLSVSFVGNVQMIRLIQKPFHYAQTHNSFRKYSPSFLKCVDFSIYFFPVSVMETSEPPESVEETSRALSSPTPVPCQPPKSQSPPFPVPPKPQVTPDTAKHPQPRFLPSLNPVPVPKKSPSYTSPPSHSKTTTQTKTPQTQSTTVTSPPVSSRTSPDKSGSKVPGLPSQTPSSPRGLPPPALPQDEPPWMALAKKKAKAWSEMPQIVQ